MVSEAKNPLFVESGRRGARKRWGPEPRVIRLDELSDPQRRLVLALVDAARSEMRKAPVVIETSTEANAEGHGNVRSAS